jgi:hypothetical protein
VAESFPCGPWIQSDYEAKEIAAGSAASYLHSVERGMCRRTYNDFCHQPCEVCGLTLPAWRGPGRVMVAHHRSPESKKHSPSALSRRANKWWEVLVAELLKCSPLCATCHAVVHDVMDDHYPSVDDEQWAYIVQQARADIANWERADGR